jgi:aspartyl-tRNA(Asn)/glutamyl-tRNA(Gln) amidotransferase subunit B
MTTTAPVTTRYEPVIGLEVHVQLLTRSKMFCGCPADYSHAAPNTHVCPVCMGMPGVLPVINRQAVEYTIMTGLALNCRIAEFSKFDRKNYPYPDLMKGYQVSQYDLPLCLNGWIEIGDGDGLKRAGITRVHLEEDTATSKHMGPDSDEGDGYTLIDVNRAGCALMEIVGEPDLRSPEEARQYLVKLRQILRYIGVSNANMEEGNFRCDANVSLRPLGASEFGAKVEIKNMNSFRSVYRALEHEIARQAVLLDRGERIPQETRGWVETEGRTASQRSKEFAHDYRYFPEPDLPPLVISREEVERLRARLPELPDTRRARFVRELGLPAYDAEQLTESRARADYFEAAVAAYSAANGAGAEVAKRVSNWMLGEMARLQNAQHHEIGEIKVKPQQLADLVRLVDEGGITGDAAKQVFETMYATGRDPSAIVDELGLARLSDEMAIERAAQQAIAANPKALADYKSGKAAALNVFFGAVMRETRGRADAASVRRVLERLLAQR